MTTAGDMIVIECDSIVIDSDRIGIKIIVEYLFTLLSYFLAVIIYQRKQGYVIYCNKIYSQYDKDYVKGALDGKTINHNLYFL